jgi:hypothetical protein
MLQMNPPFRIVTRVFSFKSFRRAFDGGLAATLLLMQWINLKNILLARTWLAVVSRGLQRSRGRIVPDK